MFPFQPGDGLTKNISVTSTSASVTLTISTHQTVLVTNTGTKTAFVKFGTGTVTAIASADVPIIAGTAQTFTVPIGSNVVAAITAGTDTTTIYVTPGQGI